MTLRVTALALVASLLLPFGLMPAAEAQTGPARARAQLPISGTVEGGGTFSGTFSLQRFVARDDQIFAVGVISGAVTGAGNAGRTGVTGPVELPVTASQAGASPAIRNQRGSAVPLDRPVIQYVQQTCGVLHLEIGGVNLDLLGLAVSLDPIVLDLSGDAGGVLGNLVCQALELLNNVVGLVGILNQLLGLLGGLTAGLGGTVPV